MVKTIESHSAKKTDSHSFHFHSNTPVRFLHHQCDRCASVIKQYYLLSHFLELTLCKGFQCIPGGLVRLCRIKVVCKRD